MIAINQYNDEFRKQFAKEPQHYFFSPGRVNLIGEHIDYNGGLVLPCAISLGITAWVTWNQSKIVRVYSIDFKEEICLDLNKDFPFQKNINQTHWSDYIKATLQVLLDKNIALNGADILLASDLPLGAGLSSSAALECLIAFIFNESYYNQNRTTLALYAQTAERQYVGVNCGIMDQFAIANGQHDHAMLLDCTTLDVENIPADFEDFGLVIINSNKPRQLADSKYNERRNECEKALKMINQFVPVDALCHAPELALAYLEDDILYQRAKHCILENKRVEDAVNYLSNGNVEAFGQLLTQSHISLDEDYEVSCDELNTIVHYATHFEHCAGARMTGAGFGGCCIALVKKDKINRFIDYIGIKYEHISKIKADFYRCEIVDGVHRIDL